MNRGLIQLVFAAMLLAVVVHASADVKTPPAGPTTQKLDSDRSNRELENKQISDSPKENGDGGGYEWLQTLGALGIVIGLIFLTRWGLRRIGLVRHLGGRNNVLQVLATTSLSPRHQMFLVRMGGRVVLVGSGPGGLARLAEVTDPDEVAQLLAAAGNGEALKSFEETQPATKANTPRPPQKGTDS